MPSLLRYWMTHLEGWETSINAVHLRKLFAKAALEDWLSRMGTQNIARIWVPGLHGVPSALDQGPADGRKNE